MPQKIPSLLRHQPFQPPQRLPRNLCCSSQQQFIATHQTSIQLVNRHFKCSKTSTRSSHHTHNYKLLAVHPLSSPNGPIYSSNEKAEILADAFEGQFSPIAGDNLPKVLNSVLIIRNYPLTNTFFTSPHTVLDIIHKQNKAPDEDAISNVALKNMPDKAIMAPTPIINGCFRITYLTSAWKGAITIFISEIGKDLKQPTSYSPIALLSLLSNVLERVIPSLIVGLIISWHQYTQRTICV